MAFAAGDWRHQGSKHSLPRLSGMLRTRCWILAVTAAMAWSAAAQQPLQLVPHGWQAVEPGEDDNTRRFVSPDGRAVLTLGEADVGQQGAAAEKQAIARQPGEIITYERNERSWLVVSGYRHGEIFYRRANLACGTTRWHLIELRYPRADKRHMDAIVTAISHRLAQFEDVCPSPADNQ